MSKYENNAQNTIFADIKEILNHIDELISDYILNKTQYNQSLIINGEKYLDLYDSMDWLAINLGKNPSFYDEYFDFCEICDIIKDTLNRDELIKQADLEFILNLIQNFSKLINYTIDLMENDAFNERNFNSRYNSYLTNFHKSEIYFYKNICDETLDDDFFSEYSNIIVE